MYKYQLQQFGFWDIAEVNSTRLKKRLLKYIPDLQAHKQGRDILLVFPEDTTSAVLKACKSDEIPLKNSEHDKEAVCLVRAAQVI